MDRFAALQAEMNEKFAKVEEERRDLREDMNRQRQDMQEGFKRHDELLQMHGRYIQKLRVSIGSLGRVWVGIWRS